MRQVGLISENIGRIFTKYSGLVDLAKDLINSPSFRDRSRDVAMKKIVKIGHINDFALSFFNTTLYKNV